MTTASIPHSFTRRFLWAGYLIGFALGGFFDGILLHQILQWHHLLSGLEQAGDLRAQVLADGLFHGLMYVIAAAGLWMLYRSRQEFTSARADRNLIADVLIGFGVWHIVDTLFSHWLTGIHRIRMDVPDPLPWDIAWLVLFGLLPFIVGLLMKRRYPRNATLADRRTRRHGLALAVLRPDVRPGEFLAALNGSNARILWSDRVGGVWVLTAAGSDALRYYRYGAMYVSGSVLPAGCSAWIKT